MTSNAFNPPVLSVSQLTQAIKLQLELSFPSVWLQGEISNAKIQSSGHFYFSIKDPQAQISAVMFRGNLAGVKTIPKDGDQVIVHGDINVYPPSGKYQIIVRELRPVGLGELLLKLEELKAKLLKKGWYDPKHKKPIPKFPKRIGVITSPTGAAIHDILNILKRRFSGFHLILNPVKVQGEGSAKEIAQAIMQFNQYKLADVLIVGRGGGSIEDLWAFNEEIVAEAIFHSEIPIISAVGHETDNCIADFVADLRAPTPSAAAEIVIAEQAHQLAHLDQTKRRLQHTVRHLLRQYRHQLEGMRRHALFASPYATLLGSKAQRLDELRQNIDAAMHNLLSRKKLMLDSHRRHVDALKPTSQIQNLRHKLLHWEKSFLNVIGMRLHTGRRLLSQKNDRLNQAWKAKFDSRRRQFKSVDKYEQLNRAWIRLFDLRQERLKKLLHTLHAINPKNLLTKGYCILFAEKDHSVITSVRKVFKNQEFRALLADGELLSIVKEVLPNEHEAIESARTEL